jgi:hypothetical protein
MHRIEDGGLIVSCDFCGTDWNGASPVIEGHRGSVICLECLKAALGELCAGAGTFKCVLCLREPINAAVERWSHPAHPRTFACKGCVHQSAEVFDADEDVDWHWEK